MTSRFIGASICCFFYIHVLVLTHSQVLSQINKNVNLKCTNVDNQKEKINEICGANTNICVFSNLNLSKENININHPKEAKIKFCVTFRKSIINLLPEDFFRIYESLKYIDLSNSHLTDIEDFTFSLKELEELDLSRNELTELSRNTFAGAQKLRKLDLKYNLISFIDPHTFSDLKALLYLNLSNNKLSNQSFSHSYELGIDWKIESLKILNLSHNNITYHDVMPFYSFSGLKNLEELYLEYNQIPIDFGAFASNKKLKTLDLSYNHMPYFDFNVLLSVRTLENLLLNGNGITYAIDLSDVRSSFPNMKQLGISENVFACEVLASIIRKADKAGINIVVDENDFVTNVRNIRGVKCI